jgi:hypothetical protein
MNAAIMDDEEERLVQTNEQTLLFPKTLKLEAHRFDLSHPICLRFAHCRFAPPLTISEGEIDQCLEIIKQSCDEV